jgi:hypothetical protein
MMSPEKIAFAIVVALFACGAIGLILQRMLPEKHMTGPSRDMVGAIVGLLTLLSALTLGLLIWTAYGSTVDAIAQSRLQMSFALSAPVSYPLVFTVVSKVALGFLGNGLVSSVGPTSAIAIIVGALAVASAFYVILDLSSPYSGIFPRVPRAAPTSAGGDGERVRRAPSRRAARRGQKTPFVARRRPR